MGLLNDAPGWLTAVLQDADERVVTYARGAVSGTFRAVLGRTAFSSNDEGGPRLVFGDRDYFIAAAGPHDDPTFEAAFGAPREGDRVTEVVRGTAVTFEVLPTDTGDPALRWSDPARWRWRIHTKQVRQET